MNDGKKGKKGKNERTERKEINERKERKEIKEHMKGKNETTRFKNKNVKRGWRLMRCDVLKNKRENAAQTVKTRYPIIRSIELVISN